MCFCMCGNWFENEHQADTHDKKVCDVTVEA